MKKRYIISRRILLFWTLFVGVGALIGSIMMFIDPMGNSTGMSGLLPDMQKLPFANVLFENLIFPGIALFLVNGVPNFIAILFLIKNKKSGIVLGMILGITLMLWIVIQFVIYPFNIMSTLFFVFGFLQFITGYVCLVGYEQSNFAFSESDYKNIAKDKTRLVVFFSRTGYTKKLAYEIANKQGAEILEIKTTERISGNLGFWWCGRYGMHKWEMPLKFVDINLKDYQEITICSPTWVFSVCAPIREFCKKFCGQVNNVNYVITHFMNCKFKKIAKEMDELLNTNCKTFSSYKCRFGKLKKIC